MTEKDDREEPDTQQDERADSNSVAVAVEEQMIPAASNDGVTKKRTKTVVVKAGKVIKKKLVRKVISSSKESPREKLIKYSALFLLIAQMVGLVLLMRYTRTHRNPGQPMYLASSAVFVMEVMKFMICCVVIAYQSSGKLVGELKFHVLDSPGEMLKLCVPSLLYTVQNNLLYLALSNLDAATYQVCYQLKILTTALFSAILLQVCDFDLISKININILLSFST
jgi:hypothetical protein